MPEQCGHGDGCSCSAAAQPQQQPQSFAPHPYPVSGASQPSWAAAIGAPPRRRRWPYRLAGLTAVATAVAVAVLITIQVTGNDDNGVPAKVVRQAQAASAGDANGGSAAAAADGAGGDTAAVNAAAS